MHKRYRHIKRNIGNYIFQLAVITVLVSIIFIFTTATIKAYKKFSYTKEISEYLENKKIFTVKMNKKLKERLEYLKSARGREDLLRSTYGLVKNGEKVIVIVKDKKENKDKTETPLTFWDKIRLNLFK